MFDDSKQNNPPDSMEFEDLENAQSASTPPRVQPTQPPQQKPQESFNIKDEVGQALETAQQAVFGTTDPVKLQQQQMDEVKKKQEDQKKIVNIKNFLTQMAQDEQQLKQQRQEEQQKKQEVEQEEIDVKQEKEMDKQKKEDSFQQQHIQAEQTKAERKLGVGG